MHHIHEGFGLETIGLSTSSSSLMTYVFTVAVHFAAGKQQHARRCRGQAAGLVYGTWTQFIGFFEFCEVRILHCLFFFPFSIPIFYTFIHYILYIYIYIIYILYIFWKRQEPIMMRNGDCAEVTYRWRLFVSLTFHWRFSDNVLGILLDGNGRSHTIGMFASLRRFRSGSTSSRHLLYFDNNRSRSLWAVGRSMLVTLEPVTAHAPNPWFRWWHILKHD